MGRRNMNIKMLKESNKIIFECISGSQAYGTNIATSDTDYRGIFKHEIKDIVTFQGYPQQISDEKQDITYYEMGRFFNLAADVNPNIVESLFTPADCIKICTLAMQKIIDNRHLFISKKAKHTFGGYAFAQIKKAKGENKWINRPITEKPNREDFCWFIDVSDYLHFSETIKTFPGMYMSDIKQFPFRPVKLSEHKVIDLSKHNIAGLERVPNVYRMYHYGWDKDTNKLNGVFKNGQIVCSDIPKDDEWTKFVGLLIYNEQEYEKAMKDYHNYNEWKKNRNEARWIHQESGELDYDCKNMMHCIRLLLSCINILNYGEPIVRFTGEQLVFLRDVRAAKFPYETLIKYAEDLIAHLDSIYESSTIPHSTDVNKIDELYKEIMLG